ncbi:cytochrome c oxidase assembly protein [Sutcliffiella horikoshii]|uniref:cytochrome c oxidase assembly protein n=1 Tax=Sutcliffiella horikoshii TaxID=79883 RepID=UPI001CBBF708|nr:cytochrome c oxidase assembly protein [Sutcliffiella horikoshii]UAL47630.1 cytochrome c oxidase assembly protein [Sutcliffiella horikoshii]
MSILTHIHHHAELGGWTSQLLVLPFLLALFLFLVAVKLSNQTYTKWPLKRTLLFIGGIIFAVSALAGPIAEKAHVDFTYHMYAHLLLGMLAPLLLALSAPMTLVMRTLSVNASRKLTRFLKSKPISVVTDPAVATVLNIGGLWVLYTTSLYEAMHQHVGLYLLVHLHVFLAGYLFTISMIYVDPTVHRRSYLYRAIIFILALAGHGILSKFIYSRPPMGVPVEQAERGSMIMYYGGDVIDGIILFILCLQWYKATRPKALGEVALEG